MSTGKIVQVIGAVVDIEFPEDAVPKINDALIAEQGDTVFEVQQQLGDGVVRTITMGSSEGLVRGMEVNRALGTLRFSKKAASNDVEKLLRSAIANWEQKNNRQAEEGELFITKIFVDGGATLKRMRPAPQGRGYRIRKRSNHVTVFVGTKEETND